MSSDHFSAQSSSYVKFRPNYPDELFDWLIKQCAVRNLAWDCACGSGQATLSLAARFQRVVATDLSRDQLECAPQCLNVDWRVAHAEDCGLQSQSLDLVTVAQALHWFDLPRFWIEARRVLKSQGVIAVWSYGVFKIGNPQIEQICHHYYNDVIGNYWPPERKIVEAGYGSIDFPFAEIPAPSFQIEVSWSLEQLLGYLSSWSATTRYRQATGIDPLTNLEKLLSVQFDGKLIRICWPISMRVGRL